VIRPRIGDARATVAARFAMVWQRRHRADWWVGRGYCHRTRAVLVVGALRLSRTSVRAEVVRACAFTYRTKAGRGRADRPSCILATPRRDDGHGEDASCNGAGDGGLVRYGLSCAGRQPERTGFSTWCNKPTHLDAGVRFRSSSPRLQCGAWRIPEAEDKGHSLIALSGGSGANPKMHRAMS